MELCDAQIIFVYNILKDMKAKLKILIGALSVLLTAGLVVLTILAIKPEIFGLHVIINEPISKQSITNDNVDLENIENNTVTAEVGDGAIAQLDGVGEAPQNAPPRIDPPLSSRDSKDDSILNPLFAKTKSVHPTCEIEPDGIWAMCGSRRHSRWVYNSNTVAETIVNCNNHFKATACPPTAD